jgi:hypothetical protein
MSQPRKVTLNPSQPQELSRDAFRQALSNAKRRISQTKGEVFDAMNDRINSELQGMDQASMQVFDKLELAQHENKQFITKIKELESKLEKYEPKQKQIQKTETETKQPPK